MANAASIAGMVLTTETAITDIKEPEPAAAGGTATSTEAADAPTAPSRGRTGTTGSAPFGVLRTSDGRRLAGPHRCPVRGRQLRYLG